MCNPKPFPNKFFKRPSFVKPFFRGRGKNSLISLGGKKSATPFFSGPFGGPKPSPSKEVIPTGFLEIVKPSS